MAYIDMEEFEYVILNEDIEVAKHKCKDYESYINGANQFRFQIKNAIRNQPTADVVEVKQIEIIRADLKWWLKTNSEKGVVFIPEFVVENMIAKMDGGKAE